MRLGAGDAGGVALPRDRCANRLFRVTPVQGGAGCLPATRRALLAPAVFPIWVGCAALFLWFWPWPAASAEHLSCLPGRSLAIEKCELEQWAMAYPVSYWAMAAIRRGPSGGPVAHPRQRESRRAADSV